LAEDLIKEQCLPHSTQRHKVCIDSLANMLISFIQLLPDATAETPGQNGQAHRQEASGSS